MTGGGELIDKTRPAARDQERDSSPESEAAVDLERLVTVGGDESHAMTVMKPLPCLKRPVDHDRRQIRIGAELADSVHVLEELLRCVGAEVGVALFFFVEVWHKLEQVVEAVITCPDRSSRVPAISPALFIRRSFEDDDVRSALTSSQRGAQRGIPRANNNDVCVVFIHGNGSPASGGQRGG